jgi:hypothetical protein
MKHVHVARVIGSRGRIWVAFDAAYNVRGTVDLSKREVLERFAALHGHYTHVTEHKGVHSPAELTAIMTDLWAEGD